jgi:hypothetical protein
MAILNLTIDPETFEDSTPRDFDPVPAGRYPVTIFDIKDVEVKNGANAGKIKLKVQFKIEEGFIASDGSKVGNRRLFADINTFGGISGPNSKNPGKPYGPFDLIALGKAIGKVESADDLSSIDTDEWLGESLQVEVEHVYKRVQHDGEWVSSDELPEEHPDYGTKRENVKAYRSLKAAATAAAAAKGKSNTKAGGFTL